MINPAYHQKLSFTAARISARLPLLLNPKLYLAFIVPILITLSVVQLVASNRLATEGEDIRTMERRKVALSSENDELLTQIAQASAMSALSEKVKGLSMKKIDKTSIVKDSVVAALP